jgi:hypothetical protein
MKTLDKTEQDILDAYDMGLLKSVVSESDLEKFKAAASSYTPKEKTQSIAQSDEISPRSSV